MVEKSIYKKPNGAGKGDKPRMGISQKEWEKKWERIFRKKDTPKKWGGSHHRTDVQMELKKLDKAIAIIQNEEQSYLRNTIRKNIEDKEDE